MKTVLTPHATLRHTPHHLHIEFTTPHQVLSSAVHNGGLVHADHLLNMKVPLVDSSTEPPEVTLSKYCATAGWDGTTIGMMTAASMDSFRMQKETEQGIDIVVLVTSGLSNPRRVGDPAEYRTMAAQPTDVGTINIIVLTSACLTGAAAVEAVLMVTEAKAAALQEAEVRSAVSHKIATGTGTDSVAVVSGQGPQTVSYCGKHVILEANSYPL